MIVRISLYSLLCLLLVTRAVDAAPEPAVTVSARGNGLALRDPASAWQCRFTLQEADGAPARMQLDASGGYMARFPDGKQLKIRLTPAAGAADLTLENGGGPAPSRFVANLQTPSGTYPARLKTAVRSDGILQTIDGLPASRRYDGIFTVSTDTAVRAVTGLDRIEPQIGGARFWLRPGARLRILPRYFQQTLGLPFYAPFRSPFAGGKIHTGWMDWYYTYGNMTESFMLNNLRWLHDHLQPFGVDVFQLDMYWYRNNNYRELDPKKFQHDLKWYVNQVRGAGFIPGIWVGPWARDERMATAHPDWFLHDSKGQIVRDWPNDAPRVSPLLDCTNPGAAQEMYDLFHYLRETIGFHYFKLDGQPVYWGRLQDARLYRPGTKPVEAYRAGYGQIRRAIGDDMMLSCWGIVTEGIGIANGSRTDGDVDLNQGYTSAADTTGRWLFLNHNTWFSDPDVLEVRAPEPLEKARAWTTLLGLSGQMLMMSDDMPALGGERVELLKRAIPVANLRPVNLYAADRPAAIDARFKRTWGTWDVVGLFNYNKAPAVASLDLATLGLESGPRYILYDFWNQRLGGLTGRSLEVILPAEGCRLFAIHRLEDHPQLLSTSRHLTQGAVDLASVEWNERSRTLSGVSRVIGGDPYTIVFSLPAIHHSFAIAGASASLVGPVTARARGGIGTVSFTAPHTSTVRWMVRFRETAGRPGPLAPPGDLTLSYVARQGATLHWKSVPGSTMYSVFRDGLPVGESSTNNFIDVGLPPFGAHVYRVEALGWIPGDSSRSVAVPLLLAPPTDLYLSELDPIREHQGWGTLQRDRSVDGHPLSIGGQHFIHGVGAHSEAGGTGEQVYRLDGAFSRFRARVGIDDETAGRGSVVFQVWVDGVKRFASGVMRGGQPPKAVDVDVRGARELRLMETDGGDGYDFDHADWGDARLFAAGMTGSAR